jgi:hypothetical protein
MRQLTHSTEIHAPLGTVWNILVKRIEHGGEFPPGARHVLVLERQGNTLLRELRGYGITMRERVTMDRQGGEIRYDLLEHPLFTGYVIQRAVPRSLQSPVTPVQLTMIVAWVPKNEEAEKKIIENLPSAIQEEVLSLKRDAEELAQE